LLNFDILVQDLICRGGFFGHELELALARLTAAWQLLSVVVLDSNMSFQEFMIAALAAIA